MVKKVSLIVALMVLSLVLTPVWAEDIDIENSQKLLSVDAPLVEETERKMVAIEDSHEYIHNYIHNAINEDNLAIENSHKLVAKN